MTAFHLTTLLMLIATISVLLLFGIEGSMAVSLFGSGLAIAGVGYFWYLDYRFTNPKPRGADK